MKTQNDNTTTTPASAPLLTGEAQASLLALLIIFQSFDADTDDAHAIVLEEAAEYILNSCAQ